MEDFVFTYVTQVIFGKDGVSKLAKKIRENSPNAKKVMIVYGSDRIKTNGLFNKVVDNLKSAEIDYVELGGVKPNPRLSKVYEGIEICKKQPIDVIVAIGGGSVIDTAKAVGCGAKYNGDVWDFFNGKAPTDTIKVCSILTIPAAGSETSLSCVVTNEEGWLKKSINNDAIRPVFAILDPELTYSLPKYQIGAGVFDMLSHVMERYFTNTEHVDLTDRMCEAVMKAIINYGPKTYAEPDNYQYRSEIMWAGSIAHNGLLNTGREQDWASHRIGMELSGIYDTTHGASLAIITPHWMEYVYKHNIDRFVQWAENVWDVKLSLDDKDAIVKEGINRLVAWSKSIGMPTTLSEANIPFDRFEEMADKCTTQDKVPVGHFVPMYKKDVMAIYELSK